MLNEMFFVPLERIDWNGFIEDVEESLEEIPEQFHPLVALMIHESYVLHISTLPSDPAMFIDVPARCYSERTSSDLVKTVKNALNPPLTGDDDSQGDENVGKKEQLPYVWLEQQTNDNGSCSGQTNFLLLLSRER